MVTYGVACVFLLSLIVKLAVIVQDGRGIGEGKNGGAGGIDFIVETSPCQDLANRLILLSAGTENYSYYFWE